MQVNTTGSMSPQGSICASMLILGMLGVLSGCATSGPAFVEESVAGNRAVVYIYRQSAAGGSASDFKIFANGQHITNMSNGGYYPYLAPAGPLEVLAKIKVTVLNFGAFIPLIKKPEVKINVRAGETYFLELQFGSLSGTKLLRVDAQKAMKEIRKCRRTSGLSSSEES